MEFDNWYSRLIYILTDFFSETTDISISKREAFNCLLSFNGLCNGSLFPNGSKSENGILKLRTILKNELLKITENEQSSDKVVSIFDNIYRIVSSYTYDDNYITEHMNTRTDKLLFGKFIVEYCKGHKNKKEITNLSTAIEGFKN
ncbi:hypothetical protein K8R14_02485 [bacterium]|nr:hypothetical protein [bacterium]